MTQLLADREASQAGMDSVEDKVDEVSDQLNILGVSEQEEHAKTRELLKSEAEDRYRRKAELQILESLWFETMKVRYETISEAHQRTFEWIIQDPTAITKPRSSFIEWAESGSGIYWISGKAGSGKSTLMRFLVDDPRTREHLGKWAPDEALDTPAFFFWNSGVPEQRSQAGLLRSIIYEVLQKHTDFFPEVVPEDWRKALELSRHEVSPVSESWSLARLQRSFKRPVGCTSEKLRFCFFIDGLDEYDRDYEEIAEHFSGLANIPFVKFCIASRPLVVFIDVFSASPSLKLQDLTSDDIEKYIKDKLSGHKRMTFLTTREPEQSEELVAQLTEKAEGVFLWVTLVVKSLLKGLSQRDGILQLRKRLDAFPSDLELLFDHMLSSVDPIYMEEGARLFQIYKTGLMQPGPWAVTLETLYLSHTVDLQRVLGSVSDDFRRARNEEVELSDLTLSEPYDISIYVPESLFDYMDQIVRTRCGGLIECKPSRDERTPRTSTSIGYIHRTVSDYLRREDIWGNICRHNTVFDPDLQLLMSHVLRLKRLFLFENLGPEPIILAIRQLWNYICGQLYWRFYSRSLESNPNIRYHLLNEFDQMATALSRKGDNLEAVKLSQCHWSNGSLHLAWKSDFLCETIRRGVAFYVEMRFLSHGESIKRVSGLPLVGFAFLANPSRLLSEGQFKILEFLLEQGADPNEVWEDHTMWQYFIHYLHTNYAKAFVIPQLSSSSKEIMKRLLENFMKRGAGLDVCCIKDSQIWNQVYDYAPQQDLDDGLKHSKLALEKHVGFSTGKDTKRSRRAASSTDSDSDSTTSTTSTGSLNSNDQEKSLESDADSVSEKEERTFEERHSLTTIFKEVFEKEDDPHGADELLELMATLKAAKQASEALKS